MSSRPSLPRSGRLRPPRLPPALTQLTLSRTALSRPLTRTVRRLETGRLVLYSVLAGVVVGLLGCALRLLLAQALRLGSDLTGYSPPGTPGEGGLLMAFGDAAPYGLLALPVVAVLAVWLNRGSAGDPLSETVSAHFKRATPLGTQLRLLLSSALAYASGLGNGRDSVYSALGALGGRATARFGRLSAAEERAITLSSVAAGLGLVLHAPLAAAVLITEVLYRRFEFEFELLVPAVLASVSAYAVYGLAFGADPLFAVPTLQVPGALQLPLYALLSLAVTAAAWLSVLASRLFSAAAWRSAAAQRWLSASRSGALRLLGAGLFGLIVAAIALYSTPAVLGGGSGWAQLALSGFLGREALGYGGWKALLIALGIRLGFMGGVLPSVAIGALLGTGLNTLLGSPLDPTVCALVAAASYLTVTLNVPVAAALLVSTWGGDGLLPAALIATGVSHALSGQLSMIDSQMRDRATAEMQRITPTTTILSAPPDHSSHSALYRVAVPGAWLGARLGLLSLPAGIEVVGVERGEQILAAGTQERLNEGDILDIVASEAAFEELRTLLNLQ